MRSASLSVMGLYNADNTLFDLLELPGNMDKDTLIGVILSNCAELEILYPNPIVMKNLIGLWSRSSQYTWEKLYNTTMLEYNPIDNYDRTETRSLQSRASGSSADGGKDTTESTDSGTDSVSLDSTTKIEVGAFDSTAAKPYEDKEKETVDSDSTTTYGKKNKNETTYGHTNANTYNKDDVETVRAYGNIGVTTTQQMIEQERNISKFNLYDIITEEFKLKFCIMVY